MKLGSARGSLVASMAGLVWGGGCGPALAGGAGEPWTPSGGAAVAVVTAERVAGRWSTAFVGPGGARATAIRFVPEGAALCGYYVGSNDERGVLRGELDGNVLAGVWVQNGQQGPFRFVFTDAAEFVGAWAYDAAPGGAWNGVRSPE